VIKSDLISYFSENIPIQNVDADLTVSARQFGAKTRYFKKEYFSRALGNGCLELLSNFDPFLEEHITKFGNPGKGKVSYMSSTICNEFINILATTLNLKIVSEIKGTKYFGISIDSTPDIAHIDQLTIIICYTTIGQEKVVERFLGFVPIE
ncbi:zinc finger MYM-type protein 1-like, partial [Aphis craccivora]